MKRVLMLLLSLLLLTGCSSLETEVNRGHAQTARFTTPALYTTADVRTIMQRTQPALHNTIICTEPSPDVTKALSLASQLSVSASKTNVGEGLASGEAAAELAGRTTALLGLRDGLYQACQAYANGAIGADAYALILSHYGQLMTTLFLGQDVAHVGSMQGIMVTSPTLNLSVGNASNKSQDPGKRPATEATTMLMASDSPPASESGKDTSGNKNVNRPGN